MTALAIHPMSLRHVPSLRRAGQFLVPLCYPDVAFASPRNGLLAALPVPVGRHHAFVAEERAPCGLAVARSEPSDFRWVMESVGATAGADASVVDLWAGLISYTVTAAGLAGAKRVHADAAADGPAHEALERAGFIAYARETLLLARGMHPGPAAEVVTRGQEPSDAWSIHHLYHLVTPKAVQYAEAFTSTHWQSVRHLRQQERGFVIERGDCLCGFCRVVSSGRQAAIEVMVLPDCPSLLPALVTQSLRAAGVDRAGHVWAIIPDYHSEYLAKLEAIGFAPVDSRVQMVRYTGVPAVATERRIQSLVSNVAERLPARVPAPAGTNARV